MEQSWPASLDDHRITLAEPPTVAWPELRGYVEEWLACTERGTFTRLLDTRPRSGFEVTAAEEPHRLTLAGRYRFSRYVLNLWMADAGDGTTIASAATYADFPARAGSSTACSSSEPGSTSSPPPPCCVACVTVWPHEFRDGSLGQPHDRERARTLRPIVVSDADAKWETVHDPERNDLTATTAIHAGCPPERRAATCFIDGRTGACAGSVQVPGFVALIRGCPRLIVWLSSGLRGPGTAGRERLTKGLLCSN